MAIYKGFLFDLLDMTSTNSKYTNLPRMLKFLQQNLVIHSVERCFELEKKYSINDTYMSKHKAEEQFELSARV